MYHTLVVALVLSRLDYGNAVLVGLPAYLYNRLQSVLNAAARSIAGLRRSDHITDTLASFHWLKDEGPGAYSVQAGDSHLSFTETSLPDLRRLSDMPPRRLRSSLTDQLHVRQSQYSVVGDRSFAESGARLWNSLPHDIVASDTLSRFRRELETFLFRQSYPSTLS